MNKSLLKLYVAMQVLKSGIVKDEDGQDLIEYALVVSLIAFAAVAGMNGIAGKIESAFSLIGSKLSSAMA